MPVWPMRRVFLPEGGGRRDAPLLQRKGRRADRTQYLIATSCRHRCVACAAFCIEGCCTGCGAIGPHDDEHQRQQVVHAGQGCLVPGRRRDRPRGFGQRQEQRSEGLRRTWRAALRTSTTGCWTLTPIC